MKKLLLIIMLGFCGCAHVKEYILCPADFMPTENTITYQIYGEGLEPGTDNVLSTFNTPVHIPTGSTIVAMETNWYCAGSTGTASLFRFSLDGQSVQLMSSSKADAGYYTTNDTEVEFRTIDNGRYTYNLYIEMKRKIDNALKLFNVKIQVDH